MTKAQAEALAGRPGNKPKRNEREHENQVELFRQAQFSVQKYPELNLLMAIPNGGHRSMAVAGKLKAEGVKKGFPDIFLPVPRGGWHGLMIEMKVEPNKPSPEQVQWLWDLTRNGYLAVVCYSTKDAWGLLIAYITGEYSIVLNSPDGNQMIISPTGNRLE